MVSLMAFLIAGLLLFSLVTPRDRRRVGNRNSKFSPHSDSTGTRLLQSNKENRHEA